MEPHQCFSLRSDVILQAGDDCALVVDLRGETIYSANGTGARVLRLIADRLSFQEISAILNQEYNVTTQKLEVELRALLHSLLDREIIVEESLP